MDTPFSARSLRSKCNIIQKAVPRINHDKEIVWICVTNTMQGVTLRRLTYLKKKNLYAYYAAQPSHLEGCNYISLKLSFVDEEEFQFTFFIGLDNNTESYYGHSWFFLDFLHLTDALNL